MNAKFSSLLCVLAWTLFGAVGFTPAVGAGDLPPHPPIVHLLAIDPCAAEEGSDTATFVVVRVGPTNEALTVCYEVGGSATGGFDYEALSGTVEVPAGAFTASITVTPIDDFLVEGWESVVVALDQPATWPPPYIVEWPSVAVAHIEDNDFDPTNRPPSVTIVNPPDGAVFFGPLDLAIVARASDPDGRVRTVEFFAGDQSLGIVTNRPGPRPAPVVAAEGEPILAVDAELYPDLNIDPRRDPIPFPIDLFRLVWSNVPPGHHVLTAVATDNLGAHRTSPPVGIHVLEAPPQPVVTVRATDPEAAEPDLDGTRLDTATFTIHRTGPTHFPLTVFYRLGGTAANGVDYRELPSSVTIPRGQPTAEVVIAPINDNLVEGDESVSLTILPPVCIEIYPPPPECYLVGDPHAARAVIHDNDTPPNRPPCVHIVRPLDGSVFLAPADIAIVARAWDFDGRVVAVEFFEGTNSLGVVHSDFSSLTNTRPPYLLVWSNVPPGRYALTAVATDDDGARGRSRPVEIRVVRHPLPPVVTITATDPIASEPGLLTVLDTATFEVRRTGSTQWPLHVQYSISGTASNGVDYRRIPGHVLMAAGASTTNIVVDPLPDRLVEGVETVGLKIEPPICIAIYPPPPECDYVVGASNRAWAFIRDADLPPTNLPPKAEIVSPADGSMFRAGSDIEISVVTVDPDGWVGRMQFFEGTNLIGDQQIMFLVPPPPGQVQHFSMIWSNVPAGGYELTARATDNLAAQTVTGPVHIRVLDSPLPPIVTIQATDPWASEGDPIRDVTLTGDGRAGYLGPPVVISNDVPDTATFTVRRSAGTNADLTVFYALSGTASNGVDYRRLSGQVTIPRGSWQAEMVVLPIDDRLIEPTESVVAELLPEPFLSGISPEGRGYIVGDPGRAVAYIRDNDYNLAPKAEIVRPVDGAMFCVGSDIEIDVVTVDPDGYVVRMEFLEGTNVIGDQQIVFIVPPPPGQVQRFSMTWSNVSVGTYVLTARATDNRGGMSVTDPVRIRVVEVFPLPVVTIEATDPVASEIDPRLDVIPDTATFTVRRQGPMSEALRVYYRVSGTASNGVDYQRLPGVVVIPSEAASAEIVVDVIDDTLVEGTESVIVALEQLRCVTTNTPPPEGCYLVGQPGRAVAYIRDDDAPPNRPPTVAIVSPPNGSVFTAPLDLRLIAAAGDPDGWVVTVEFFDGNVSLGVVTNRPWILEPVRLTELEGAILTGLAPTPMPLPPPFALVWSNVPPGRHVLTALATDNLGARTRSSPVEITVLEADHIPVVNIMATDGFAREGAANTATFKIRRCGSKEELLTVHYAIRGTARNGVDYVTLPESVTIPAGRRVARITVIPIDDRIPEPIETVILRLRPSLVDPPAYQIGRPASAGAIIVDNDHPRPCSQGLPDGHVLTRIPMLNGMPFRLEASGDLLNWEIAVSSVVTEDGIDYLEGESEAFKCRFYRVVPEFDLATEEE